MAHNEVLPQWAYDFCFHLLGTIDCPYFAYYMFQSNTQARIIVSNYPQDWIDYYQGQKYEIIDYPVVESVKHFSPICWGEFDFQKLSSAQKEIFYKAREYNIYQGITIPLHAPRQNSTLTFTYGDDIANLREILAALGRDLQMIGQLFDTYIHLALSSKAGDQATDQLKFAPHLQECVRIFNQKFSELKQEKFIKKVQNI